MSGNIVGAVKAQTGFGKKDYQPGSMIAKMNLIKSSNKEEDMTTKKTVSKKASPKKVTTGLKKTGTFKGKSNKLGGGGRFAQVVSKLKGKVKNPKAVAASIGRKSLGKAKFQKLAAKGKAKATKKSTSKKVSKVTAKKKLL